MLLLKRNGFTGFLLDDHAPHMDGDTDWNHRGRAHAIGYMQGLMRMEALAAEAVHAAPAPTGTGARPNASRYRRRTT